ncbi:hypothetical protein ACFLZW_07965 [Chloroflexota bacterium]
MNTYYFATINWDKSEIHQLKNDVEAELMCQYIANKFQRIVKVFKLIETYTPSTVNT